MKNAENFQRSASAPVGIVAAVSMKTTANRNIARLPASWLTLTNPNYQIYKGLDITMNKRYSNRWQAGVGVTMPAIAQTPAENTKVNTRDRAKDAVTADQQKENRPDRVDVP